MWGSWIIVLVLFPGILAMKVRDVITGTGKRTFDESLIAGAIYMLLVYGVLTLLSLAGMGLTPLPIGENASFNPWTAFAAILIALAIGSLSGLSDEWGWALRMAHWRDLCSRGWRNTWFDTFRLNKRKWVSVHLENGIQITGWAQLISDDGKQPSIYVAKGDEDDEKVIITTADGSRMLEVPGPGVLVTANAKITLIEFLEGVEKCD